MPKRTRARSAETGKIVTKDFAKQNPKTTITEKVRDVIARGQKRADKARAKAVTKKK